MYDRSFGRISPSLPASGGLLAPSGVIERHATEQSPREDDDRHYAENPTDASATIAITAITCHSTISQRSTAINWRIDYTITIAPTSAPAHRSNANQRQKPMWLRRLKRGHLRDKIE
jgi:hypothetical protein